MDRRQRARNIHVGIIGCGHWGPNHVRNFSHITGSRALMCADLRTERLRAMKQTFRNIIPTTDYKQILSHPGIDAVVIATPASTHHRLVKESLLAGKDVLCEKPLCLEPRQASELQRIAKRKRRILMVGHVFLFNPGIQKLKEMIDRATTGRTYYIHAERTNLGPFRHDVNSSWDLGFHDIYILNYLIGATPIEVSARGGSYLQKKVDDVTFITLAYPRGVLANIHVSWLNPRKVRKITVVGSKKMLVWDDLDDEAPVKCYEREVIKERYYETFGEFHLLAKRGSITIPPVVPQEPLKAQDQYFLECLKKRESPFVNGASGYDTVRVCAAVQKSLARGGAPIRVK